MVCLAGGVALAKEEPTVYLIRLDGMINDAYAKAVIRKMTDAVDKGAELIILELNTGGGGVRPSLEIAEFIFTQMDVRVIAYINTKAYSGGTMVALACDEIYIDAAVGAMGDVQAIDQSGKEVPEKFEAPVRKAMSNFADQRGYPAALAEAMVAKEYEVWRIHMKDDPPGHYQYIESADLELMREEQREKIDTKELIVRKEELFTLSAKDAVEYGFAKKGVTSRKALYDELKVTDGQVQRLYLTPSERVLTVLDSFSPLFFIGGLILLFIEMTHPGFGLPGIAGLVLLGVFFVVKVTLHYARMLEILLFVAGVVLLLLEVLVIPGFGIAGIAGICLLFASVVLMMQQFTLPSTPLETDAFLRNILTVLGMFVVTAGGLLLLARYVGSVPILSRLVSRHTLAGATVASTGKGKEGATSGLLGQVGVAVTPLRPTGRAEFDERLLDVVTEGDFLEKGTPLEIIEVRGRQVVVRPYRGA